MTSPSDRHHWTAALVAFDLDDTAPLASLIEGEAVPVELRPAIAAIVAGTRRPNRRAAVKSKVPAAERFQIGATVAALLDVIGDMKHPAITGNWADMRLVEPSDAIVRLNQHIEQVYSVAADRLGVSRETVENLVREYREKVKNWPSV